MINTENQPDFIDSINGEIDSQRSLVCSQGTEWTVESRTRIQAASLQHPGFYPSLCHTATEKLPCPETLMNKGHLASRSSQPNQGANPSGHKCDTTVVITQTKFCGTIGKTGWGLPWWLSGKLSTCCSGDIG